MPLTALPMELNSEVTAYEPDSVSNDKDHTESVIELIEGVTIICDPDSNSNVINNGYFNEPTKCDPNSVQA